MKINPRIEQGRARYEIGKPKHPKYRFYSSPLAAAASGERFIEPNDVNFFAALIAMSNPHLFVFDKTIPGDSSASMNLDSDSVDFLLEEVYVGGLEVIAGEKIPMLLKSIEDKKIAFPDVFCAVSSLKEAVDDTLCTINCPTESIYIGPARDLVKYIPKKDIHSVRFQMPFSYTIVPCLGLNGDKGITKK